jgi:uncharacterized protein with FMN-binding domain
MLRREQAFASRSGVVAEDIVNVDAARVRDLVELGAQHYPNHTDRSVFINQQALSYLIQEVLQAQFNPNISLISGTTATSIGFEQSLQAALVAAKKV